MDPEITTGVVSAQPDKNSCQVDITHPDLRHLAAVGQVSDSPEGTYSATDRISSEKLDNTELSRTPRPGDRAPIDVSRGPAVADFRAINIRNRGTYQDGVVVLLDTADAARLEDLPWYLLVTKQGKRYAVAHIDGGLAYMHREVLGAPGRAQVDHRDGNTLDNRRSNLRIATPTQQRANSRKRRGSYSSSFKGVSRCKGRWKAVVGGTYLGLFHTESAAARAYDRAARARFGEFALVNFPVSE